MGIYVCGYICIFVFMYVEKYLWTFSLIVFLCVGNSLCSFFFFFFPTFSEVCKFVNLLFCSVIPL